MTTILFLHGFFASGSCIPALTLKEAFEGKVEVLTPDLPLHPMAALDFVRGLCAKARPSLLVGNSCGSFLAQMSVPVVNVPALLGNPHLEMTAFLRTRLGKHQYKSPRQDGKQEFVIDEGLIEEFARLERCQFDGCTPYYKDKVWGLFGERDTLAHYEPLFAAHYSHVFHFPGGHTPTAEEVRGWYVPLVERMLQAFPQPDETHLVT